MVKSLRRATHSQIVKNNARRKSNVVAKKKKELWKIYSSVYPQETVREPVVVPLVTIEEFNRYVFKGGVWYWVDEWGQETPIQKGLE